MHHINYFRIKQEDKYLELKEMRVGVVGPVPYLLDTSDLPQIENLTIFSDNTAVLAVGKV